MLQPILMKNNLLAALRLACSRGPENGVSKRWLLRTSSRLNRKYTNSVGHCLSQCGDFQEARIRNQVFLWPREACSATFLQVLAEILTPNHPHQYQYGPTIVGRDDVVLDIGACEGSFSALVTGHCKRVISVEPSPSMCRLIEALFARRNQPCPQILNCLLSDKCGEAYFWEDAHNPGSSRIALETTPGAAKLPVRTIDEIVETLEEKPTFIKCDAEGAEPKIFSGGRKFLEKFHPKLAITTYHSADDFAVMHALLKSIGYRVMGKGFLYTQGAFRVMMIHAW